MNKIRKSLVVHILKCEFTLMQSLMPSLRGGVAAYVFMFALGSAMADQSVDDLLQQYQKTGSVSTLRSAFNNTLAEDNSKPGEKLSELFQILAISRAGFDPTFNPKMPVSIDVTPPGYANGVDPQSVTDPVKRAAYEAAIVQNNENMKIFIKQSKLRMLYKLFIKKITVYLKLDCPEIGPANIIQIISGLNAGDDVKKAIQQSMLDPSHA